MSVGGGDFLAWFKLSERFLLQRQNNKIPKIQTTATAPAMIADNNSRSNPPLCVALDGSCALLSFFFVLVGKELDIAVVPEGV